MSIRHPIGRGVNLTALRTELSDRLGFHVELVAQEATDGHPGEVICEDPKTGEWLDVDDKTVADVIAAHVPPPRRRTREEEALMAFDAAPSVASKLDVFRDYLAGQVAAQAARRQLLNSLRMDAQ